MPILVYEPPVGFMLKVRKSGVDLGPFRDEFNAIRHGDYIEFIRLIGQPSESIYVWRDGQILINQPASPEDTDVELLIKAAPSLKLFHKRCIEFFGDIKDPDMPDFVFYRCALFEISIRCHAKNRLLVNGRQSLESVINVLSMACQLNQDETFKLHQSRRFINAVKTNNLKHFSNWRSGVSELIKGFNVLTEKHLTII